MGYSFQILNYRKKDVGMELLIQSPDIIKENLKRFRSGEIILDDGCHISSLQRKKIYAILRDIADYTGYLPEECKEHMKYYHMQKKDCEYFSLKECSMTTAREFINTLIDFSLKNGIEIHGNMLDRTDDINTYLMQCLKYRKCCVCGRESEVHHVDTIGMGNDRRKVDDSKKRVMALCRKHHTIYHQIGYEKFYYMYHVYGIEKEELLMFLNESELF